MRSHSQRFARTMRSSSQTIAHKVSLWYGGSPVAGADNLALASGTVAWDRQALVRGTCNLTLVEPLRIPTPANLSTGMTPWGYSVVISAGVQYSPDRAPGGFLLDQNGDPLTDENGDPLSGGLGGLTYSEPELLQLGVFYLTDIEFNGDGLAAGLSGADRSMRISRARLEDTTVIAAGVNVTTAIQFLLRDADPTLEFASASTRFLTPATTIPAQADPWEEATKMATSIGCELFIDSYDRCVIRDESQQAGSDPVWEFRQGPDGTLMSVSSAYTGEAVYNRTIVTGSDPALSFVPRGVATDVDPNSPIRYDGPHGRVPRFFSSPFIQTNEQAAQAAASIQASDSGMARAVALEAVAHWALEPGDVVRVVYPELNIDDLYAMERFGFDLVTGSMSL